VSVIANIFVFMFPTPFVLLFCSPNCQATRHTDKDNWEVKNEQLCKQIID